jgi:hypothetical protein
MLVIIIIMKTEKRQEKNLPRPSRTTFPLLEAQLRAVDIPKSSSVEASRK